MENRQVQSRHPDEEGGKLLRDKVQSIAVMVILVIKSNLMFQGVNFVTDYLTRITPSEKTCNVSLVLSKKKKTKFVSN